MTMAPCFRQTYDGLHKDYFTFEDAQAVWTALSWILTFFCDDQKFEWNDLEKIQLLLDLVLINHIKN